MGHGKLVEKRVGGKQFWVGQPRNKFYLLGGVHGFHGYFQFFQHCVGYRQRPDLRAFGGRAKAIVVKEEELVGLLDVIRPQKRVSMALRRHVRR